MSTDMKDSIKAIADIPFEATTSKTMDESEKYHARIMRDVILGDLENKLRDAVTKRSNTIYFWLENVYAHDKPKPYHNSAALSEGLKAIRELPWVAHAEFGFEHPGPLLKLYLQNPETKKRLFPENDDYGREYYEGEKTKKIEPAVKPKALPPPTISPLERLLINIGLKKKPQLAIAPPVQEVAPPAPEKTANEKLSEQFSDAAESIKSYAAQIPGLKVDFTALDNALEKIDALLTAKWDEDVIGAGRSSYRRALHDLKFLGDSFKEHAQILSLVNQGCTNDDDLQTVSPEQLSGLQRNFENVSRSVENAATRAINARLDRAEIGIAVHDTRLQIEQFRDVELVAARTAKVTPEM